MGFIKEQEMDQLYYNNFVEDLDENPGWYEYLFDVPIEDIKADPRRYYDMDIDKKGKEKPKEKPEVEAEGLF